MTHSSKQSDYIIKKGLQFINDNPEIIKEIYKEISYNDEPKLYRYVAYFKDKYSDAKNKDAIASGVSFKKKKALLKILGETIERYSLSTNNNKKLLYKSFSELIILGKSALDPKTLILFSNKKRYSYNLDEKKLHWVEGKSLIPSKKKLVPAQLVYVPYLYQSSEPLIRFPTSTGAAAGASLDEALYRGICEVVERDAFMIAYLNKLSSPRIALFSIEDGEIRNIVDIFKRYKLEPIVLDLTNDLQIPVFSAITVDRTGLGPAISVGLKAGFNIKETIIGAIEESLMVRSGTRDNLAYRNPRKNKSISAIEDRAHFWFPLSTIKYLDFWTNGKNLKKINIRHLNDSDSNLEKVVKLLKKRKIEVIYIDITDKEIKQYDFMVVKVIIPQLHPLYLDERCPYLGGKRLYNVPVQMGILQKAKTKSQLNKVPHPFL